jgi:lipopolysaccharide biosynthesis glycosyltransferase
VTNTDPIRIYSVVSNPFRYGFLVMARTVLASNPGRQISFRVLFHPELSPLDPNYRQWLGECIPSIEFLEADLSNYENIFHLRDKVFHTPRRLWAAFLILEAFADDEPGQVLCLDSDMICLAPLDEDLFAEKGFRAVEACSPKGKPLGYFNTGVMRIGRDARGPDAYRWVMSTRSGAGFNYRAGRADQALLSLLYTPKNASCVDGRYNVTRRQVPHTGVKERLANMRAVFFHYVGAKPWHVSLDRRDLKGIEAEALWDAVVRENLTQVEYIGYLEAWRDLSRKLVRTHIKENPPVPLIVFFRRVIRRLRGMPPT